jgi:hypothetical protein
MFAKHADLPARLDFQSAAADNADGIGIMSADGVEKFNGKRSTRRAWRYAQYLSHAGIPYAVHFRYATHGRVGRALTHPFRVPETGDFVMHNGVLSQTARFATDSESDTSLFCREYLPYYSSRRTDRDAWLSEVEQDTYGSRLLFMSDDGRDFSIVHETWGDWCRGIWYSNTYSLVAPDTAAIHWRAYTRKTTAKATRVLPATVRAPSSDFDWHNTETWGEYQSSPYAPLNQFDGDVDTIDDSAREQDARDDSRDYISEMCRGLFSRGRE